MSRRLTKSQQERAIELLRDASSESISYGTALFVKIGKLLRDIEDEICHKQSADQISKEMGRDWRYEYTIIRARHPEILDLLSDVELDCNNSFENKKIESLGVRANAILDKIQSDTYNG